MSPKVSYALVIAVGAYGIYQLFTDRLVVGGLSIAIALLLFLLLRKR